MSQAPLAGLAWLASRPQPPAPAVKLVVDADLLWAALRTVSR
ncbi:hypothetical protein [Streptomyces sp. WAC08241]|nr:hypothetical protein [Streptomyces sp. WAC08241]